MRSKNDLTIGNVKSSMLRFALPYLLSCFLQTFYGLADLFIVGLYNGSETSTAISIGSQAMHMFTVMLAGIAMGTTVELGHSIGAKDFDRARKIVGTSIFFFTILAVISTVVLSLSTGTLTQVMMTPVEAVDETNRYLRICFLGLPFIIAYNFIGSVYRGAGDSRSPMVFIAIACVVNIVVDFIFIGYFSMGAAGAAYGTVLGQAFSVLVSLLYIKKIGLGFKLSRHDIRHDRELGGIIKVGFPICMQDGLIQIAFLLITVIANSRGLIDSVSVGIVEKVISFMFLVPSAFLSAISAFTAQNIGAGKSNRARESLRFGITVTVIWGLICAVACNLSPEVFIMFFRREPQIIAASVQYLRPYSFDCIFAAVHFCFSGYFCGSQKSGISFLHNILSVALVRVPGAYLASLWFPDTLFPMGLAAPAGSLFSVIICVAFYWYYRRNDVEINNKIVED